MKKQQDNKSKTGISVLIDQNAKTLLKFPMMDLICEKFVENMSFQLREALNIELLLELEPVKSIKFSDYMQKEQSGSIFCITSSSELLGNFMINLPSKIVFSFLSILLGGSKKIKSVELETRPFTAIEMEMIKHILEMIIKNLNFAFSIILPFSSKIERIETDKNMIKISKQEEVLIYFRVNIKIDTESCYFDVVFPYNALEPIKKILSQPFLGDKIIPDPNWSNHLERELKNTKVRLELILDGAVSKISELLNLKIGSTIVLDKFAEEPLDVTINGIKVSMGKLGKTEDKVAIQLLDDINIKKFNHIL